MKKGFFSQLFNSKPIRVGVYKHTMEQIINYVKYANKDYINKNADYVNEEYRKWYNDLQQGKAGGKRTPSLKKYQKRNRNKTIRIR